jgi:hypothetical protein
MKKVLVFISISMGGWIGWWLGGHVGIMTAYFLSIFGGAAGLFAGRRLMNKYME